MSVGTPYWCMTRVGGATYAGATGTNQQRKRKTKPLTSQNTMDFEAYEKAASRTLRPEDEQAKTLTPQQTTLLLGAMGMAGEAGEFLDHVKKHLFHDQPLSEERLTKMSAELGDILWYHSCACRALVTSMSTVAQGNVDKLLKRHPNGVDFGYHDKKTKATEKAALIALEGRVYKDAPNAQFVFISADNEHRVNISEQELGNHPDQGEGVIRQLVMERLTDVFEKE